MTTARMRAVTTLTPSTTAIPLGWHTLIADWCTAGISADVAEFELVWGESPVTAKPQLEERRQVSIRGIVAPELTDEFACGHHRDR